MESKFDIINMPLFVEHLKRDVHFKMAASHYHNTYEIYLLEEGTRRIIMNQNYYEINKYDVALISPNVFHQTDGKTAHTRITIYFSDKYLSEYFTDQLKNALLDCFNNNIVSISRESFLEIKNLSKKISDDFSSGAPTDRSALWLSRILEILNNSISYNQNNIYNKNMPELIQKSIGYINENYLNIEYISQIADHFFVSKNYLCNTFKKHTGLTLIQYINLLKVQYACELLTKSNKSVTEIGFTCGFHSTVYFCQTFKAQTSLTPKQFRNSARI